MERQLDGGSTCGAAPCWQIRGSGYLYLDRRAVPETGVKRLKLTGEGTPRTAVRLVGRGLMLGPPRLPLAQEPEVVAQLSNTEGDCWETAFLTNTANEADDFTARSFAP